jgi:hypothetical protein
MEVTVVLPPTPAVIPKVFCEIEDTSAATRRPPGDDVVSRITESAPRLGLPLLDRVWEGVVVTVCVPVRVAEFEEPDEADAEGLSGVITTPRTMAPQP